VSNTKSAITPEAQFAAWLHVIVEQIRKARDDFQTEIRTQETREIKPARPGKARKPHGSRSQKRSQHLRKS